MAQGILPITSLPAWPTPAAGVMSGLVSLLPGAFISPDGIHVSDVATAQNFLSSYVGSAAQLAFNKSALLDQLAALYLSKFGAGFNYTGPDAVKRSFQIDATSQFNIDVQANASLGALLNSEVWDTTSYFIDANNLHMATPRAQDMRAFALATRSHVSAIILNNRALKDKINAAATMATLAAIDLNSGWPANP